MDQRLERGQGRLQEGDEHPCEEGDAEGAKGAGVVGEAGVDAGEGEAGGGGGQSLPLPDPPWVIGAGDTAEEFDH